MHLLQTHRRFTLLGVFLLIATFLINYYHETDHPGDGFNYAYVTGVAMIGAFLISFVLFTKNNL